MRVFSILNMAVVPMAEFPIGEAVECQRGSLAIQLTHGGIPMEEFRAGVIGRELSGKGCAACTAAHW